MPPPTGPGRHGSAHLQEEPATPALNIIAVLVTYHPDRAHLVSLIETIAATVAELVIVDNATPGFAENRQDIEKKPHVFIPLNENIGLAAAQNVGIRRALEAGADAVLLLDQDSSLTQQNVLDLIDALCRFGPEMPLAALGPQYTETNTGKAFALPKSRRFSVDWRVPTLSNGHAWLQGRELPEIVPVDYVISSGALIPAQALARAGLTDERLFIDLIDVEWGLRARSVGLTSYVATTIQAPHTVGHDTITVFGRRIVVHHPFRNYYWTRNAVHLAKQASTPRPWRLFFIFRLISYTVVYGTLTAPRWRRLTACARGLRDGLLGRFDREPSDVR